MFHQKNIYQLANAYDDAKSSNTIAKYISKTDYESESIKCSINYKPFLGLFYTALSSVFFTLGSVFVKQLSYISPGQLSMIRNTIEWIGCLPIVIYSVREVLGPKQEMPMLVVRGLLVATALYLNMMAFRYLPLAEAAIILATIPAVTSVMAHFYLNEPCGLVQALALMITVGGVLLSVRLPELWNKSKNYELDTNYILGIASSLGCVLIFSVSFVALRKMRHIHFSVILIYTGFIGMVENGIINVTSSYFAAPRCRWDQIKVLLIGIFSFIGQCTLYFAIQLESVGIVSLMCASMKIIVAIVFQVIFFNDSPDIYNLSGACLVAVSVSVIGLKKWIVALPEESETRKRFKYILL